MTPKQPPAPPTPIDKADIDAFVANDSGFAFEMSVVSELRVGGYECQHSGTYRDPVTDKTRQYDIRGSFTATAGAPGRLLVAVECKRLTEYAPLLISTSPRRPDEAFVEMVQPASHSVTRHPEPRAYKQTDPVGRKTDQIRRGDGNTLESADRESFERGQQAVNSCAAMVDAAISQTHSAARIIVPVMVVPEGTLWQVDYGDDGRLRREARQVQRVPLVLGVRWPCPRLDGSYTLSHLEIITAGSVSHWLAELFLLSSTFPA